MRSFKFLLQTEVRAVVPEAFLERQLEAARADDHTKFQEQLIAKYEAACEEARGDEALISDAGDQFLLELMGNGLRMGLRGHSIAMLEGSGVGGTVAPVQILERVALKPEEEAVEAEEGVLK